MAVLRGFPRPCTAVAEIAQEGAHREQIAAPAAAIAISAAGFVKEPTKAPAL